MHFSRIYKVMVIMMVLLPSFAFAQAQSSTCSLKGYTIETINGVFTNEDGAILNRDALKYYFKDTFNNQPLTVDYLHNPSHLAGVGDILMSVYQKIFDNETVQDYDLIEMLKSASEKIKTQKLLLIAHSQGNFYANSFYDKVAGKQGGVPAESIGVYSIATPSGRVAGGGKWLTSDTDKVIAGVVGRVPFKNIMSPNTHIELQNDDDTAGHNFKDIYLKYRSAEIVSDIQVSLNRLSENASQNENKSCLSPPELTIAHKIEGAVFAVADPAANMSGDALALTVKNGAIAVASAYNTAVSAAQTAIAVASSITAVAKSLTGRATANLAGNNGAAVVATQQASPISPAVSAVAKNSGSIAKSSSPTLAVNPTIASAVSASGKPSLSPETPSVPKTEVKAMTEKGSPPKLVFVGLRMSGRGSAPPLDPVEKLETAKIETVAEEKLSAPALKASQCDGSLSTDGCLLATTTVRFEWAPVSGAFYYALNKNGAYATTTETTLDIIASDFSDYSFEVAAVGASGQKSATSTKTISVATIPIAINEIAWMGTIASSYDEWLELKNNTGHTISLSQWAIESKDNTPRIALSGSIAPREYLVLERRGGTVVIDSSIFTYGNGSSEWALGNSGEELVLSHSGTVFDSTPAITGGAWPAGVSSAKKTMERYASKESGADIFNWGTNLGFISNGEDADGEDISGTPGAKNSVSFLINKGRNITENLTLTADEGSFVVPNEILITASSTLVIKPGVEIMLYKDYSSYADGRFYIWGIVGARGTAENPIIFSSYSGYLDNYIGGIWFNDAPGVSNFDYVRFENVDNIGLNNSKLEIHNTDFINTAGGVNAYNGSSVVIENVRLENLKDDAFGAYNNSVITIASTVIDGISNGDSIGAYNGSIITIASSTINNVEGDGVGAFNSSIITIASSTISNIGGDGIGIYNDSSLVMALLHEY